MLALAGLKPRGGASDLVWSLRSVLGDGDAPAVAAGAEHVRVDLGAPRMMGTGRGGTHKSKWVPPIRTDDEVEWIRFTYPPPLDCAWHCE